MQDPDYEYIDDVSNDIDSGGFSEGSEGDSDYTGDDSFTESDYATSDDYEEVEYDYELAEDPVPLEEVCQSSSFEINSTPCHGPMVGEVEFGIP